MQPRFNRRSTPKVRDGKVQGKNRHIPTTHQGCVIERRPPGKGYTHVLSKKNVQDFIRLLPDWAACSERLERIVLAPGDSLDGYHRFCRREGTGSIALCAWDRKIHTVVSKPYFLAHRKHFDALGIACDRRLLLHVLCKFTVPQARAFTLLHVFLHELGHHADWLARRSGYSRQAEEIAESFANRNFKVLLPAYIARFGDPRKPDEMTGETPYGDSTPPPAAKSEIA